MRYFFCFVFVQEQFIVNSDIQFVGGEEVEVVFFEVFKGFVLWKVQF